MQKNGPQLGSLPKLIESKEILNDICVILLRPNDSIINPTNNLSYFYSHFNTDRTRANSHLVALHRFFREWMRHFDVRWSIGAMHWWYYSTVIQIHSTCRCSSNFQKNLVILKHFSRELSWPKLKWLFSINKKHTSTITAINVLFLETNSQKTYLMYFKNSPFFFSPQKKIPK